MCVHEVSAWTKQKYLRVQEERQDVAMDMGLFNRANSWHELTWAELNREGEKSIRAKPWG